MTGDIGTIFLSGEWVLEGAPSVFDSVVPTGECERNMFDNRDESFAIRQAWCFNTNFTDEEKTVEIQVNQEFIEAEALTHA